MDDITLIKLITDPDAPTAAALGARGSSTARVSDLVSFVAGRTDVSSRGEIESEIDRVLLANGGARTGSIELNELFRNVWRRVRREPRVTGPEMYEIPKALYERAGNAQHKVQLP